MLTIVLIIAILFVVTVNGAVIIQGTRTIIFNETDIVITCSVTSVSFIYWLNMYKNSTDNNLGYVQIATIGGPNPDGKLAASMTNRGGVTMTGSSVQTTAGTLKLTISKDNVRCTDAAMYQCQASVVLQTNGPTVTETSNTNLAVQITAKPTSISPLIRDPPGTAVDGQQNTYRYSVGTVVTLTCISTVGRPAKDHRWCRKGPNDPKWVDVSISEMINQDAALVYLPSTCDYKRNSTLTFKVTTKDINVEITCEPKNGTNFFCGSSSLKEQITLTLTNDMPEQPVFSSSQSLYTLREDVDSLPNIKCEANCNLPCNFTWLKDGKTISDGKVLGGIKNIKRTAAGQYVCSARNDYGTRESILSVVVLYDDDDGMPSEGDDKNMYIAGVVMLVIGLVTLTAGVGLVIWFCLTRKRLS